MKEKLNEKFMMGYDKEMRLEELVFIIKIIIIFIRN